MLAYLKTATACPNFTKFSVTVTCGHGSVLLWQQCNTLCTCGFLDVIMFAHNPWGKGDVNRVFTQSDSPGAVLGQSLMSTVALFVMKIVCSVPSFSQKYKSCRPSRKSCRWSCITLSRHSSKDLAGNEITFCSDLSVHNFYLCRCHVVMSRLFCM